MPPCMPPLVRIPLRCIAFLDLPAPCSVCVPNFHQGAPVVMLRVVLALQPFNQLNSAPDYQPLPVLNQVARQVIIAYRAGGMHIPFFVSKFRMRPHAHVVGGVNLAGVVLAATDTWQACVTQPDEPIEPELRLVSALTERLLLEAFLAIGGALGLLLDLPAQGDGAVWVWAAPLPIPDRLVLCLADGASLKRHGFI